jgi:hypothetical protein
MLPSKDQWETMFKATGGLAISWNGLNTTIITAGGTGLQSDGQYWSSTDYTTGYAYYVSFLSSNNAVFTYNTYGGIYRVRACLAF